MVKYRGFSKKQKKEYNLWNRYQKYRMKKRLRNLDFLSFKQFKKRREFPIFRYRRNVSESYAKMIDNHPIFRRKRR